MKRSFLPRACLKFTSPYFEFKRDSTSKDAKNVSSKLSLPGGMSALFNVTLKCLFVIILSVIPSQMNIAIVLFLIQEVHVKIFL